MVQIFEQQLERLKKACGVGSDTAFAQYLGIRQGSVSGAKQKRRLPYAWFFQVAEKTGISADWLFFGRSALQIDEESTESAKVGQCSAAPSAAEIREGGCRHCEVIKKVLEEERQERRQLSADLRELHLENRRLWQENSRLREQHARLELQKA